MTATKTPRVFLGTVEVCGYYTNLQKGFTETGTPSNFLNLLDHPFEYAGGNDYPRSLEFFVRFVRKSIKNRTSPNLPFLFKMIGLPLETLARSIILIWALAKHDVFIFGFATSILWLYDLPLIKLFGKRIIFVFHGSDSRPPYLSGLYYNGDLNYSAHYCIQIARQQKSRIRWIERFADVIVSHPPSSHFFEHKFIPWLRAGIPFQIAQQQLSKTNPTINNDSKVSKKIRIVHAPSKSEYKGTTFFRNIIQRLISDGCPIEFIELSGKKNHEVLQVLSNCDFVIDELYSDTTMATLATEAAFFGKPSIVGGYAISGDFGVPINLIPPTKYVRPEEFEQAVRAMIESEPARLQSGENARNFIGQHWTPRKVAQRFLLMIRGDIPPEWFYEPSQITYHHGWGLKEENAKSLINHVVLKAGKKALQLTDKPDLEAELIKFSAIDE